VKNKKLYIFLPTLGGKLHSKNFLEEQYFAHFFLNWLVTALGWLVTELGISTVNKKTCKKYLIHFRFAMKSKTVATAMNSNAHAQNKPVIFLQFFPTAD
jgi:hypothetical protein